MMSTNKLRQALQVLNHWNRHGPRSLEFRFLKHHIGKYVTCLVVIWTTSFGLRSVGSPVIGYLYILLLDTLI